MAKSKKLAPVTNVVKKAVSNKLDGAKARVDATKLAKQSQLDSKQLVKTLQKIDKEQTKEQNKLAKRQQRLAKLASATGVNELSHPFDTTSRSSSGYEI